MTLAAPTYTLHVGQTRKPRDLQLLAYLYLFYFTFSTSLNGTPVLSHSHIILRQVGSGWTIYLRAPDLCLVCKVFLVDCTTTCSGGRAAFYRKTLRARP